MIFYINFIVVFIIKLITNLNLTKIVTKLNIILYRFIFMIDLPPILNLISIDFYKQQTHHPHRPYGRW